MAFARQLIVGTGLGMGLVGLGLVACSSSDAPSTEPTGTAGANSGSAGKAGGGASGTIGVGAQGGGGSSSIAGTTSIAGGSAVAGSGGAAAASGASGSGGASGAGTAGSASGGASAGAGGATSLGGAPGGTRTPPTCTTPTPSPNGARAGECDYIVQSLDFEDKYSYATAPGDIKITSYGNSLGQSAINNCSPYCYGKNLTVGIDIVGGGSAADQQGEIIVEFPQTGPGLPIAIADKSRASLAWITFDGKAKPTFEIDTQLVFETTTGIVPAVEVKKFFGTGQKVPFGPFNITNDYSYGNGCEFKYFDVTTASGFPSMPTNITGIGFRITGKATAGQEWHGVAYIDHLQIRNGAAGNAPQGAGAYPYGL